MLIFNPKIRIKQIWPLVPIDPLINLKLSKLRRICWMLVTFVPSPLTFEIARALCCNITERYFQTNSMEKNAYKSDLKLKKTLIILIGVDIFWFPLTLLSGKPYELDQIYLKTQTGNVVRNLTKNLTSKLDLKWTFKILGAGLLWSPNTCIYETVRATTNL